MVHTWQFLLRQDSKMRITSKSDRPNLEISQEIRISPSFNSLSNCPSWRLASGFRDDIFSSTHLSILIFWAFANFLISNSLCYRVCLLELTLIYPIIAILNPFVMIDFLILKPVKVFFLIERLCSYGYNINTRPTLGYLKR